MAFTYSGTRIWPVPPDWSAGVQEALRWSSDVMQATATAVTQHRALRTAPRRSFTFEVLAGGQDRRVADMLLAGYAGTWDLPIWPDVQRIQMPLALGATEVPCATNGFDFVAGGRALLLSSINRWEVVQVGSVAADHIGLAVPNAVAFGRGSRLFPLRRARVQDGAQELLRNDDLGRRSIAFDIVEACDWPSLTGGAIYLGHPVLEVRPDESEDPTAAYGRIAQIVDYGTAYPVVHDLPGLALRSQQSSWKLMGRAEHSWFRSLLYTLDGRRVPMWIPSWTADLKPAASIAGGAVALPIEWAGYTLFGQGQPNRKDVRIQLDDGTTLYRRIVASAEVGAGETVVLNAALDAGSIAPERIRSVSFMALCAQASDEVEIDHATDADGVATSTTGWLAVVPDV